jgi:tetratricopeptide (TPR) repeat protein
MGRFSIRLRTAAAALLIVLAGPAPARANRASDILKARAASEFYNLDQPLSIASYRAAIAADPQDAGAYRGLASALWMTITLGRGMLTVDSYLGAVSRDNVGLPSAAQEIVTEFHKAIDRAIALSRARVAANPKDTDAQFQLGAAVALRASYAASVDGSVRQAFSAAREAYDAHETVISLDPRRHDAGLIVGTYRYLVAALSLPLRWVAYMAGFGGGRERGLQLIEGAAEYNGENQSDARVALVLLYNRERRFDEAANELARLRAQFPRNRLFWLETGGTLLRAGKTAEAERFLSDGLARFASDGRPRLFSEEALWYYKRGLARAILGRTADADRDLRHALSVDGRKWVHGRAHLEIGKLLLKSGNRSAASSELRMAITLCNADRDPVAAAEATALLR